jgi:hypothetical protein
MRICAAAAGSASPRSQRETFIADVFNRLASASCVSFRAFRKANILRDQSRTELADFRIIRVQWGRLVAALREPIFNVDPRKSIVLESPVAILV